MPELARIRFNGHTIRPSTACTLDLSWGRAKGATTRVY